MGRVVLLDTSVNGSVNGCRKGRRCSDCCWLLLLLLLGLQLLAVVWGGHMLLLLLCCRSLLRRGWTLRLRTFSPFPHSLLLLLLL
jgi:hypothetical protein